MPSLPVAENSNQDAQQQPQSTSTVSPAFLKERRFKLSRACDRCRRRRIKCDEGHPCQACLGAHSSCTFEEPGKRTHPHKSKRTTTLEDRMQQLESLIQAIPPAVFATLPTQSSPGQISQSAPSTPLYPPHLSQSASGVPPPSMHVFPLTNPSTHFTTKAGDRARTDSLNMGSQFDMMSEQFGEEISHTSISASCLYFDDEGYTRWQGETSGLPALKILAERHKPLPGADKSPSVSSSVLDPGQVDRLASAMDTDWFPDRSPRRIHVNPQTLWCIMTSSIAPDLMDSLVQCYLSTSYYILPFLHVPTFLADYGNPEKWGEPGFAAFIAAVCCLASRHIDDPRVRADPNDSLSAGTHWFELFGRLRTLPIADRPTLYNIQANLIAAVYAVGLGKVSGAASLLAEAVTMCIDGGLHRSADPYDVFDPIEGEVRKRTFWSVYIWDKQLCAHFGRPPMIRLRDCDVPEPSPVDDEFITHDGIRMPLPGMECRLSAFICSLRMMVVLESVICAPFVKPADDSTSFLLRASHVLSTPRQKKELCEEEALLDEVHRSISSHWAHSAETLASEDTIRVTQAQRLHCAEHFVRLLIYRHRLSGLLSEGTNTGLEEPPSEPEKDALRAAQNSALQIINAHLQIAKKGLMTYYGVHVIQQLTQAGKTLVTVLLNCRTEDLQPLIIEGLNALRSCVSLLRRFSGRYVCGLRSGDLLEEFCRLTQIPLETSQNNEPSSSDRPPWIRPVKKRTLSPCSTNSSPSRRPPWMRAEKKRVLSSRSVYSTDSSQPPSTPDSISPLELLAEPLQGGLTSLTASPSLGPSLSLDADNDGVIHTSLFMPDGNSKSDSSITELALDPQLLLFPGDTMGPFDGVDMQHLFLGDYSLPPLDNSQTPQPENLMFLESSEFVNPEQPASSPLPT